MNTEQAPMGSGFGFGTTADEIVAAFDTDLSGKTVVITGGYAGIGKETTRVLAKAGATIVAGARDMAKAQAGLDGISGVEIVPLDLADPGSIDRFAEAFIESGRALDLLINNAGIMATPLMRDSRGYEMQFATNHLGHFQLTSRLWDSLRKAGDARIVSLTSAGHRRSPVHLDDPNYLNRPYDKWTAYGQSKTANSLFALEADRRGAAEGIRAFAVHPGGILETDLSRYLSEDDLTAMGITRENGVITHSRIPLKTLEQGASTTLWCAVSPQLVGKGGVYCADCDISPRVPDDSTEFSGVRRWAVDPEAAKALWDLSETLVFGDK